METENIITNLNSVEQRIADACKRSGRKREEVTLIAVSKTKPIEMIKDAYDYGIRIFGENRVQELIEKKELLPSNIEWHLIGHLQRNKAKMIVGNTTLIHSVESMQLAAELSKLSVTKGIITEILIEINIAGEKSKYGIAPDEALSFIKNVSGLNGIKIRGLMTVAPIVSDPEENRKYFSKMRQLTVDIKAENIDNVSMDFISMGMTGDFETAIEEGATHVRIGTGIFGER